MIKSKLLLIAIIAASFILPAAAVRATDAVIKIDDLDKPYYNHGPSYKVHDYEMVWTPGHMHERHWIHGKYVRVDKHNDHAAADKPKK